MNARQFKQWLNRRVVSRLKGEPERETARLLGQLIHKKLEADGYEISSYLIGRDYEVQQARMSRRRPQADEN